MILLRKLSNSLQISKSLRFSVHRTKQYDVQPKPQPSPTFIKSWFSTTPTFSHSEDSSLPPGNIPVNFVLKDGSVVNALGRDGEIALRLAQRYDVPMEGACEASLACTTCHCYVDQDEFFDMLPEATEEEEDLLDKAPFLDMTSRLGCQIILTEELSGIMLRLPRATANFYVDGHVPTPH
jgi:ferredoxin